MSQFHLLNSLISFYNYIVFTFPEYFFPFGDTIYQSLMHSDIFGVKLYVIIYFVVYREILHLLGSCLFVLLSIKFSKYKKHLDIAILSLVLLFILFQEFYLQPKYLNQPLPKGILDTVAWFVPILIYTYFRYYKKKN